MSCPEESARLDAIAAERALARRRDALSRTGRTLEAFTWRTLLGSYTIPAGTKVRTLECPTEPEGVVWTVDSFDWIDRSDFYHHDATHYGVHVDRKNVQEDI